MEVRRPLWKKIPADYEVNVKIGVNIKMHIAMLIEAWKPIWAGGQIHVWELCHNLIEEYGCEVDLFVMNLPQKEKEPEYPTEESHLGGKLNIFRVGGKAPPILIHRMRWGRKVVKLILRKNKEKKYDLIHAHANFPGFPAKILSRKLKVPLVYTIHGCGLQSIKEMYGKGIKSLILYWSEKFLQTRIKYDTEITVDSSFLQYNNGNKKIAVIPNGVNIHKFDAVEIKKSRTFKVIFVGRIHPQKGLVYLLEALSRVKKEPNTFEVHLIGTGELEAELQERSKILGLDKIVKFRGKIYGDDLIKEYKSAHLFVLPSLYEGQPLTLLEAWAAKLPVIVTDVGGNKDFVIEGENGYIIPAKDVNKLADTLLKAIKNKELSKMGEKGYELVKNNYGWEKMGKMVYEVYKELVKKNRPN